MNTYDGMPCADLAGLLGTPQLICEPTVTSTLDVAHARAAAGAPHGTAVLADEQTRGRGRQGRVWHSPRGAGIWLAHVVRPVDDPRSGVLALRVGMAVADAVGMLGAGVRVKWPNDVMLGDRKLAGILCEVRRPPAGAWVAVGIGLNVHGPVPANLAAEATSLDAAVPGVSRVAVLEVLVPRLHALPHGVTLSDAERERFAAVDWLRDRPIVAPHPGTARGIAADGALLVETDRGTRRVTGGGVRAA